MDNKATFRYIQDPGHGWLEVPRQLLAELGIEYDITRYSYVEGAKAYLEEDCDMSLFMAEFEKQLPDVELDLIDVVVEHTHIRGLPAYPMTRPGVSR